jgi:hypothetical protein
MSSSLEFAENVFDSPVFSAWEVLDLRPHFHADSNQVDRHSRMDGLPLRQQMVKLVAYFLELHQ